MDKNEEEFSGFCDQLKQMTEVYDNTIKKYKEKNPSVWYTEKYNRYIHGRILHNG